MLISFANLFYTIFRVLSLAFHPALSSKKNDVFKPENLLLQQNLGEVGAPPSFLAVYPLLGDGL